MDKSVYLVTLLLICSSALFRAYTCAAADAHAFCSRALATRSCPKPPTIDTINLEAYLGHWYEIGSTASFKLLTETGLSCNQALYTSTAGKLSLLNSGLQVMDGTAQVRGVNTAAGGVCSGARQACYQLEAAGKVSQALEGIHTELAHQIDSWAEAAALNLQRIAGDIANIQFLNGQISQANVSSLPASIVDIKRFVKAARREQRHVVALVDEVNKLIAQLSYQAEISGGNRRHQLEEAAKALTPVAAKVKASSSSMKLSLTALKAQASSLLTTGEPIEDPQVYSVTGNITQPSATSAGKLKVTIFGMEAPYWIIGLESDSKGAYSAALVYVCSEVAGESATTLFLLSREPQLDQATLHGFLAKAESLGVYNDCENPFLFTLQRGGTCGKPPSS